MTRAEGKTAELRGSGTSSKPRVLCAQEDYPATEVALQKALSLDPNLPEAYDLLVRTYLARNKLPEAAKELESVLCKNDPTIRRQR